MKLSIHWFRNDLRLVDNPVLCQAMGGNNYLPIFVVDKRQWPVGELYATKADSPKTKWFGFPKATEWKCKFLVESLHALSQSLEKHAYTLHCGVGLPEVVIPDLIKSIQLKTLAEITVFCHPEVTSEETLVENKLTSALAQLVPPVRLVKVKGGTTLRHPDDLPFAIKDTPMVFTQFRKLVEGQGKAIRPIQVVKEWKPPISIEFELPGLPPLPSIQCDERTVFPFSGGESSGLNRVQDYIATGIASYKQTRNGLLGVNYSSKWSAWLAFGCISARFIHHQLAKSEWNEGSEWMVFELVWRDYWKFHVARVGNGVFFWDGTTGTKPPSHQLPKLSPEQQHLVKAWKEGRTGFPLVDASMRELAATGFLSNRSRQNVASFLVHNLKCPWLYGAEYFESQLVDYDVCSNYGNWQYAAGVGVDPRERVFNVVKQAKDYDPNGDYIVQWVPELSHVAGTQAIFTPWVTALSNEKGYPKPIVPPQSSHNAMVGKPEKRATPRGSDWKIKNYRK